MGRKPDLQKKTEIEHTARKLFLEHGFQKTSYRVIADAMGTEKSNIQKHFPKKDIFIDHFFEDLLDSVSEYYLSHGFSEEDYFGSLYRIGVIQFSYLLSTPDMRRFTLSILSERDLTEALIHKDMDWAAGYLTRYPIQETQGFKDNVAVVMGGVYELVYQSLNDGRTIHPEKIMDNAIRLFAFTLGISTEQTDKVLKGIDLPDSLITESIPYLDSKLF